MHQTDHQAVNDPTLELRNVSKSFPGVRALKRASVSILRGEVHALLGENGAGKSTMVKIIGGEYSPDEGTIILEGEEVRLRDPRDSLNKGIGIIHQELMLVPELSVAENIFLGRYPRRMFAGVQWTELRRHAQQILEQIGLNVDPDTIVSQLPTGAQQQVEIARAISMHPKLLIMDEPTSALAEQEVRRLFEVIRGLKEEGLTVIYISHHLEEIWEIADRLTVLRDGKVVFTRAATEVSETELAEAMVGRELSKFESTKTTVENNVASGNDEKVTSGEPRLTVRGLTNATLRDINIEVNPGEVVGLGGALGSGRTELLRAIYGADQITDGEILINNTEVHIGSPAIAIRHRIYLLPEDRKQEGLLLDMSVADNISLPYIDRLTNLGFVSRGSQASVADRFVNRLKIKTPGLNQRVENLSGGNQQKTILARWLSMEPRVLLLDQPTRGVDIGAKEEIYELIQELAKSGVAVLFVATELPELLRVCDRIYVMRNGMIAQEFAAPGCSEEDLFLAAVGEERN